ncbi:unnamed protein product [Paramecium pentaurelia]|uniref:Uncharacterized protein n=1 Tax=Paramecium pentaurelia TaxID=43138 RepID=A0A8S1UHY5_9CILI|nr:unnamed protein product [Paramecium pentaurelia]
MSSFLTHTKDELYDSIRLKDIVKSNESNRTLTQKIYQSNSILRIFRLKIMKIHLQKLKIHFFKIKILFLFLQNNLYKIQNKAKEYLQIQN